MEEIQNKIDKIHAEMDEMRIYPLWKWIWEGCNDRAYYNLISLHQLYLMKQIQLLKLIIKAKKGGKSKHGKL